MELLSKSEGKHSPYLTLGKIVSPHSLRGALKVYSLSDFPERFLELETIWLLKDPEAETARGPIRILEAQPYKGNTFLIQLEGVPDRTAAEAFVGLYVGLPADQAMDLPEDTFYARDLIGFEVCDTAGTVLGEVANLIQGHQDLIVLRTPAETEHWIPFVRALVPEVDMRARRLVVAPLEGLLEL
ncbi:MAG: 16S rRNA processing protein RimM [Candidatus Melainabacteria bacterium HGW-Melainabacteria-1]|nr:MAG: 16S rRNA processing protein RimM [Candidatus Melainabacteria bacterium HGW-Melainabacteria-1]